MPRRRINCRIIVKVCGLLLLGTVLTIAAAWGAAVRLGLMDWGDGELSAPTNDEVRWWKTTVSPETEYEPTNVLRPDCTPVGSDAVIMYSFRGTVLAANANRYRFGLPLQSLEFYEWAIDPGPSSSFEQHSSWHWEFDVHRDGIPSTVFVPLTPIWSGFAIDTLFFATLSALILAGWGHLIRRQRLKRGRCPACKYPIGASPVCTECGEALPTDVPTAPTRHA